MLALLLTALITSTPVEPMDISLRSMRDPPLGNCKPTEFEDVLSCLDNEGNVWFTNVQPTKEETDAYDAEYVKP